MKRRPPSLRRGARIAPGFEVVRLLDRSPSLEVYDVWSVERSSRCIAKTVRLGTGREPRHRRKVLREGRLLRRLAHPHLVRAFEIFGEPRPVVILETLTGETLAHVIRRLGRLTPLDATWLGLQLCSVVGYLHAHQVLHLDLKPENIVSEAGRAKLLDLSVARRPGRHRPGIGTDGYRSPEQVSGGELTPKADVWGIGTVLFEALTGDLPHSGDAPIGWPAPSVRSRRRGLPSGLSAAVDASLSFDPAGRPTVAQLSAQLAASAGVDPRREGVDT